MRTETFQFAFHDRVAKTPPEGGNIVEYFNRLKKGETLTRLEKNLLFHNLQGNGPDYKLAGWVFPFAQFMKRFLVHYTYGDWREVWAFDKTCIRNSFYTKSNICEIHELPKK